MAVRQHHPAPQAANPPGGSTTAPPPEFPGADVPLLDIVLDPHSLRTRMKPRLQFLAHRAFLAGIALKALDGLLEMSGGIALMLTPRPAIRQLVTVLTHAELIEDPHDFLANLLVNLSRHLSIDTQHFASLYLLVHGLIKLGLGIGLWRGVGWSYPAGLLFLLTFVCYQADHAARTHSVALLLLTALDLVIAALIWREWQQLKARRLTSSPCPEPSRSRGNSV